MGEGTHAKTKGRDDTATEGARAGSLKKEKKGGALRGIETERKERKRENIYEAICLEKEIKGSQTHVRIDA